MLYADDTWSLLVIFQAMDAAGKDSTIKHVMSGINPQGCQVYSFKHPSAEELDHDFLWRSAKALPERGRIGIFNRSYYEEVLIVKVHPELVDRAAHSRRRCRRKKFWEHRYDSINNFERHLTRNGTAIVKFFLYVSKDEAAQAVPGADRRSGQALEILRHRPGGARLLGRLHGRPTRTASSQTSTKSAPWYVIPADHKWVSRALVAAVLDRDDPFPRSQMAQSHRRAKAVYQGSPAKARSGGGKMTNNSAYTLSPPLTAYAPLGPPLHVPSRSSE